MAAASSVYTGVIGYNTISHRAGVDPNFGAGSADDMLNDKLQTGDVILFSRRWYNYHLPQAACIKLYQMTHDTSYDHLGVIVCDKFGTPYLFEQTFFGGYRVRLFEPRIMYSRAHQITAVMLMPREGKRPDASAVDDYVSRAISKGGGTGGWYDDFSNIMADPGSSGSSVALCSKLNTLMTFFDKLDLVVGEAGEEGQGGSKKKGKLSCKHILSHEVDVREKHPTVGEKGRYMSPTEVLIRTT